MERSAWEKVACDVVWRQHAHARAHTHTHTHARTHAHARTHTHTHTHSEADCSGMGSSHLSSGLFFLCQQSKIHWIHISRNQGIISNFVVFLHLSARLYPKALIFIKTNICYMNVTLKCIENHFFSTFNCMLCIDLIVFDQHISLKLW